MQYKAEIKGKEFQTKRLVLRKFKKEDFESVYSFIDQYIKTKHFISDPRYLLEYLTTCSTIYPTECLRLLTNMIIPKEVDSSKKVYFGDEPLILVLAIYSKLRLEKFKYRKEQVMALDMFDKLIEIPSIRYRALDAMDKVLD